MIKNIIIGVLSVIVIVIASLALVGNNQPKSEDLNLKGGTRFANGISTDSTSPSSGEIRTTSLTVTAASTLTGTSTLTKSVDGFVAFDDFSVATGTAKAVYTNSFSDQMCDAESGFIDAVASGAQAPSLVLSLGTTTSATGYSAGLLSSTTLATSTSPVLPLTYTVPFKLKNGESIVGALSDANGIISSSTNYSNWDIDFGVHCWMLEG